MQNLVVQLRTGFRTSPDYKGCWVLACSFEQRLLEMRIHKAGKEETVRFFDCDSSTRDDKELLTREEIKKEIDDIEEMYYDHDNPDDVFDRDAYEERFMEISPRHVEIMDEMKLRWQMIKRIVELHNT